MTVEEARAVLVEGSARIITAYLAKQEAKRALDEAWAALNEAALPLIGLGRPPEITADVEDECFLESCELAGVDPEHPDLRIFREEIELRRKRDSAPLN